MTPRPWPKTQRAAITAYRNRLTELGLRAPIRDATVSPHHPPRSVIVQFTSDEDRDRFLASIREDPIHQARINTWWGVSPMRDLQVLIAADE